MFKRHLIGTTSGLILEIYKLDKFELARQKILKGAMCYKSPNYKSFLVEVVKYDSSNGVLLYIPSFNSSTGKVDLEGVWLRDFERYISDLVAFKGVLYRSRIANDYFAIVVDNDVKFMIKLVRDVEVTKYFADSTAIAIDFNILGKSLSLLIEKDDWSCKISECI